jgi:hypothetical protein
MDLEYSPSAATALLLANLTSLASRAIPNSTSTSVELDGPTSSGVTPVSPSLAGGTGQTKDSFAIPIVATISPVNHSTDVSQLAHDYLRRLDLFPSIASTPAVVPSPATPTVYIFNQAAAPVPIPSPPGWSPDPDAIISSVAVIAILMATGAGCWLLRRYRPDAWRSVKVVVGRVLRALALPVSWLFSQAAVILRRLHQEGSAQVSHFISLLVSWYTLSYAIGP